MSRAEHSLPGGVRADLELGTVTTLLLNSSCSGLIFQPMSSPLSAEVLANVLLGCTVLFFVVCSTVTFNLVAYALL